MDVQQFREGELTQRLERQTARIPSTVYMGAAFVSMGLSLALKLAGRDEGALFVGQWAAPFLLMGVYNKLVKQMGSHGERVSQAA
jgi:hypothetical protein